MRKDTCYGGSLHITSHLIATQVRQGCFFTSVLQVNLDPIASRSGGKLQIYLYDSRPHILQFTFSAGMEPDPQERVTLSTDRK